MSLCVYRSALCDTSEVVAVAYYAAVAEVYGTGGRGDSDGALGSDRSYSAGGSGGVDLSCGVGCRGGLLRGCDWQCAEYEREAVDGAGEGKVVVQGDCSDGSGGQAGDVSCGVYGSSGVGIGSDGGSVLTAGGDGVQVDPKKLARREKNKRRRSNRKERKDSGYGGPFATKWCSGVSGQSSRIDCTKDERSGTESSTSGTGREKGEHCGGIESSSVPVWRRGAASILSGSGGVGLKKGFFSDLSTEQRVELQASRAALLVKQNQLAAERADRELEVLRATDIEVEKRRQSTKLRAAIERNMVSIEKTHATLKATDNVGRDELDHDVHTVVTDGVPSLSSGSISPNSSASMAEYRAVQKQLLDEQKKLSDKEVETEKLYAVLKKIGIEPGVVDYLDKDMWTINSQGTLDDDAKVALEVLAPEGYVIPGQAYVSKGDKVTIRAL